MNRALHFAMKGTHYTNNPSQIIGEDNMLTIIFIISLIGSIAWNWKGYKHKTRGIYGGHTRVYDFYATIFCTLLIFFVLVFIAEKTGLYIPPYNN